MDSRRPISALDVAGERGGPEEECVVGRVGEGGVGVGVWASEVKAEATPALSGDGGDRPVEEEGVPLGMEIGIISGGSGG